MLLEKQAKYGLLIVSLFTLLFYVLEIDAHARAGRGGSLGSRGSKSYFSPSSPARNAATSPQQMSPLPSQRMKQSQGGGFLQHMAGGLVGGLIGGMLFRSMGMAGSSESSGAGVGFFEIILIGAILYGIWRFTMKRHG